jgi:PPOX class probable F420-dependent enzyme
MAVDLSEKARAYLQELRFAVLATINQDGTPQLTTMWYLLEDDGSILMNTKVGRLKERNMRRDPRISICIEDDYNFLTISGTVQLIADPERAQYDILRLSTRYHGVEKARVPPKTRG